MSPSIVNGRAVLMGGAVLLLAAACSRQKPPVILPTPDRTIDFVAQGDPDPQVVPRFVGKAEIRGGWIQVTVPDARLVLGPGKDEKWRNLTVRAMVAADYQRGNFRAPAEARRVLMWRWLDFPAAIPDSKGARTVRILDTLRFLVPIPPGADLATSRLAFETEWTFAVDGYGETESRFVFVPLVTGKPPVP